MPKSANFLKNLRKTFFSCFYKDSGEGLESLEAIAAKEQKNFKFETLVAATEDFSPKNKLGQGGFGAVFRGRLKDGREIAVKRLSQTSHQGKREFLNEAKLLARVQHRNVVSLLGYCAHGDEKLLVYEYVAHESLDKILFDASRRSQLDWKRRYDIIVGIARGLLYLHEDSHSCIIHRDIKASNILLDDNWNPKIADFGMAKLFPEDQTHVNTRVAGTSGYMAPEYVMHGILSIKADVFSYGIVVLELISGKKNSAFIAEPDVQSLPEWAWVLFKKGRCLEVMDPTLATSASADQIAICIKIALLCTQVDPKLRPTMQRVLVLFSKKPGNLGEPTRPIYYGSRYSPARMPEGKSLSSVWSSQPGSSSQAASTSASGTNSISFNTSTATALALARSPRPQRYGKEPLQE